MEAIVDRTKLNSVTGDSFNAPRRDTRENYAKTIEDNYVQKFSLRPPSDKLGHGKQNQKKKN